MRVSISKFLTVLILFHLMFSKLSAEQRTWRDFIPNITVFQYAGNIGMFSAGAGWDYGYKNHWETHFLVGYLPKEEMWDDQFTATLREHYLPFDFKFNEHYSLQPLMFTVSLNTIFSDEFWISEPAIDKYFRFASKFRLHIGVGGRWNYKRYNRRYSIFYEVSTYDLALISYVRSSHLPLKELLSLGVGFNIRLF